MVGSDSDWIYFCAPSWSRPGLVHDISVSKRDGKIFCLCEDAIYRKKRPELVELLRAEPVACKHALALRQAYRRLLEP